MNNIYITIVGQTHYYGMTPYKIGNLLRLVKEPENDYDTEAIRVELPYIDKIGYVANSSNTVFAGTFSAGRIYDKIGEYGYARVMFVTHSSVIAVLVPNEVVEAGEENDVVS